ncbi:MAG: CPBP family glutamic-type intramembrane protease [Planctomycetota bacterium]
MKRFFLWSPSADTAVAAMSVVLLTILAYLGLVLFEETWLSFLIFVLIGTVGVCVILPLYWMVVRRKKGLDTLGITTKHWLASLLAGVFLAGFSLWGYYHSFGISAAIIPSLIVGVYALWEVVFGCGWLQLRFEEAFGIIPGIILSALCVGLYHIGYGWLDLSILVGIFIASIFMAVIFRFTKNILILWPFFGPIACLRGFKMGGFSPDWTMAGYSVVSLVLMLISIFLFYRIQNRSVKPGTC